MCIHAVVWMIYRIFAGHPELDISAIHRVYFGRYAGKAVDLFFLLYFAFGAFLMCRSHIAVIRVWLFPTIPIWSILLILLILFYYTVSGGLRTINGASLWGTLAVVLCKIPLVFLLWKYLHPLNLKPLIDHTLQEFLISSKDMTLQYIGVEALLMLYPFIKSPAKSQKWAQLSVLVATVLYTALILITYMFFSEGQLRLLIWPTFHMYMIIQLPFFQRLEYLVTSIFLVPLLANISLSLWVSCRFAKRSFHLKQWISLLVLLGGIGILGMLITNYETLQKLTKMYNTVGFYVLYAYIPILFIISQLKARRSLKTT
ncbi:GerAB/ArcD/ProY family transporter [Paenibacillus swuensis]|uniref:GerAB/ArcD/ProY family transporter n=1 Tax=Paenibacillus swuensis TaxID=1178515 RepID=UPI0018D42ABC